MGDVLTQAEIDQLLEDLNKGGGKDIVIEPPSTQKEAKNYDFARPSKFNKEQLRTLEVIFDNFARLVSSFLTAYLRTPSHIEAVNAEQLTYNEFNNSLVNPVILGIVELHPLKGSVLVELSSEIGYSIIDRILGGPGISLKKVRDFSEIEKILLERVISQLLVYLIDPWANVVNFVPKLDKIETNWQFAQIIAPTDMIALVTLTVKIGSSEGMMNFCIPHLVIEPIMQKLNTKYWFTQITHDNTEYYKESIEEQLEKALINISAIVGRTKITVNDFVNLQVGDIIPLDSYINSDLDIMVGNLLKFRAKPGISRNKNAIQITSLLRKEE